MDNDEKEMWRECQKGQRGTVWGAFAMIYYLTVGYVFNREKHNLARDLLRLSWEDSGSVEKC